jgi:hypothetical protein
MSGGGTDGAPVAEFPPTVTHGGRFQLFNIFGNLFEITGKYRGPIMPIGRGAYGIVWYAALLCAVRFDTCLPAGLGWFWLAATLAKLMANDSREVRIFRWDRSDRSVKQ